ncbi:MAG: TRAP-type C4-dicarboxylate transport system, small permease component [Clostridia bacterium]|jgi:TRAP-type C4-dicarboxylate transport system permease small subunit|nr:TRAP-type C4-dicarboxylate transport system, small permease component [Clostridia bacterium]
MQKLQSWIDKVTTVISSTMLAVMMIILTTNVILRYIPGIGGFKWYMESSQYLNVWAMFIIGIAICAHTEHLNVNILEGVVKGFGKKIIKTIVTIFTILFYIGLAYGAFLLATKSKQEISTMAPLKMAYVYWLIPIVSILSAISAFIGLMVDLSRKEKGGNKI